MEVLNQPNEDFNQSNYNSFENLPSKPNNNLVLAIVGTVIGICSPCCCPGLIAGIIAIIFSVQVDSKYGTGDYIGAEKAAKNAKILAYVALGLGILGLIYSIVTFATGGSDIYMEKYQEILEASGQ